MKYKLRREIIRRYFGRDFVRHSIPYLRMGREIELSYGAFCSMSNQIVFPSRRWYGDNKVRITKATIYENDEILQAMAGKYFSEGACSETMLSGRQGWLYEMANGSKFVKSYSTIVCSVDAKGIYRRHWAYRSVTSDKHMSIAGMCPPYYLYDRIPVVPFGAGFFGSRPSS